MALEGMLQGGGTRWASPEFGQTIAGKILEVREQQRSDFKTKEKLTWDDGRPQMEAVIIIQPSPALPKVDDDDDGKRAVHIKSWGIQLEALRAAVKAAGGSGVEVGGTFSTSLTGKDGDTNIYAYGYAPPVPLSGMVADQQPTHPAYNQPATPAPAPAAAEPAKGDPVETAKQLIRLGQEDSVIVAATGLDAAVVSAVRNAVSAGVA